ncbi:MAG: hypothetical protein H0U04_02815 [Rubrobacter sp.]|nr:hypothetical protein [Rubrobacter sp.]
MSEANEHQVPNLEAMGEQEAYRFLTELLSNLSPEEEYNVRHQDYVMEMPPVRRALPGAGEHEGVPGSLPATLAAVYPVAPSVSQGGTVGCRGGRRLRRRAEVFDVVLILELRDGKMWRDRWYFAEPFEAPEWRAQWVERMDT